ncbi:MAG: tripartite tricarboxylate transporter substrate binding protein [Xanthobacteraceae bacterium]|nr:tripartite tricarboxylate transporter substrate binding protein [Xanthobacteraceae bacterium]
MKACRTGTTAALFAFLLVVSHVSAQQPASSFPEKTVRIIVPFPAGGATDILARLVAERLSGALGRAVVVENISGAAGATGTAAAAKAVPDGHALLMGTGTTTTLLPHLRGDLPYDPERDFAAVTLIASFPNLLVVRPGIPATDVKSLIELVRASPGKLSYASSGFGASPHLSAEWFKRLTMTDILHVPYTGSGPALPALLGGHVDMMFDTLPSVLPLVQQGKLRALGVTTAERVPFLPDIPAIAETLPEFDVTSWLGIMVPSGVSADVRARIAAPLVSFVKEPAIVKRMQELGAVAATINTPQEFDAWIRRDHEKWRRVIRETGIKIAK